MFPASIADIGEETSDNTKLDALEHICRHRPSIVTIVLVLDKSSSQRRHLKRLNEMNLVSEASPQVDAGFRAFQSLKEITVDVREQSLNDGINMVIHEYGWKIRVAEEEKVDEWDSDVTDYEYNSELSDDCGDDDIDNERAFWRRLRGTVENEARSSTANPYFEDW